MLHEDELVDTYRGHRYYVDHDDDDDVRKITHILVTPEGKKTYMRFSPYSVITATVFETFIDMGCPSPSGWVANGNNFSNEFFTNLRSVAETLSIDYTDPSKHDLLRVAMKLSAA